MKNNEQTIFKPNASKPVYKFNLSGDVVHVYPRTTDAIKEEHIPYSRLKDILASGLPLHDHTFSLYPDKSVPVTNSEKVVPVNEENRAPWESDNGMFDISGWGKVCF